MTFEKELQNCLADSQIQVECSVNKLELLNASVQKLLHFRKETLAVELTDGDIQSRKTKLTGKRAPPRGFDIDDSMCDILIRVKIIGELDVWQAGHRGGQTFFGRGIPVQNIAAQLRKYEVSFTLNDKVREIGELKAIEFIADFGPPRTIFAVWQNSRRSRASRVMGSTFQMYTLSPHDFRLVSGNRVDDLKRMVLNHKLKQCRL